MITKEKAISYIQKHQRIECTEESFKDFSRVYQTLGLLLSNQYQNHSHGEVAWEDYYRQLQEQTAGNPWTSDEGKKLAEILFGSVIAPFVADIWTLMDQLPYQKGYYRRPFRIDPKNGYITTKIQQLVNLYYGGGNGFNSMSITDQMQYAVYANHGGLSLFLATVLIKDQNTYYPLLEEIFLGEHQIGGVSGELIKALLISEDSVNHELVEKLLLAAQQQEGLRQTILETLDFTSVKALKRFINVILEHNLVRFSSVVRAVDTWFGFSWDAPKASTIRRVLELADKYLNNPGEIEQGLKSQDNMEVYIALWAKGIEEVDAANLLAFQLVFDGNAEHIKKLIALFFVYETQRTRHDLVPYAEKNLGKDIELDYWMTVNFPAFDLSEDLFQKIFAIAQQLPSAGKTFEGRGFSWKSYVIKPEYFFDILIKNATPAQVIELSKKLHIIPSNSREQLMRKVFPDHYTYSWSSRSGDNKVAKTFDLKQDAWQRQVARQAFTDRNASVAATGMTVLRSVTLYPEDINVLENVLSRKGKDLRSTAIGLLAGQTDERVKETVERLIHAGNIDQRLAALEILMLLHESERVSDFVHTQIETYKTRQLTKNERIFVDKFSDKTTAYGFENGFGAIDYDQLTNFKLPEEKFKRKKKNILKRLTGNKSEFLFEELIDTKKTVEAVNKLFDLFDKHKNYEYQHEGYRGETETSILVNNLRPLRLLERDATAEAHLDNLPLAEVWKQWYHDTRLNEFEIYSVIQYCYDHYYSNLDYELLRGFKAQYLPNFKGINFGEEPYYYQSRTEKISRILTCLSDVYADKKMWTSYKLDVLEDLIFHFPKGLKNKPFKQSSYYYSNEVYWYSFVLNLAYSIYEPDLEFLDEEQQFRLWQLQYYILANELSKNAEIQDIKECVPHLPKVLAPETSTKFMTPYTELTLSLFNQDKLNKDDLLFLGLLNSDLFYFLDGGQNYHTKRFEHISIPRITEKLKNNLLQIELERGDLPTEASRYISNFATVEGVRFFFEVLQRMGKDKFDRGYSYGTNVSKKYTFSQILKLSTLSEEDTYDTFAETLRENKFDKKRLVEVSCYATQWAEWLGDYLKINKLQEAVWWFLAHTTDYMNAEKETIISRYSNVPKDDFQKGAIDIEWFQRVYGNLGKANWKLVHEAAKYLSDGMGYRRVKLYSSVLLGETKITETLKKIIEKRDKDYVMALGLIPISKANPEADLLKRYNLLQTFLQESKQFGAQRQESEKRAVEIGLDNLARNAGFDDSVRFSWAMEGKATQQIMDNASVEIGDRILELVMDEMGKADIVVNKNGKVLKTIPDKIKKDKRVEQLKEGKNYLRKQYARTRQSLENAMLRRDEFSVEELGKIMAHPVVHAMLGKLVLIDRHAGISGFWKDGQLLGVDGNLQSLHSEQRFLIAHPAHLYEAVQWDLYQRYIFDEQIQQPFKQVFRELYALTADEREHSNRSERYQGHQIQPNKTVALLRGRGWTVNYDEGLQKVYHKEGYLATLFAMADWFSPSEVEAPSLEYVCFYSLKDGKVVPLTDIDPVIFSETMRDVDLVVSVAHVGEVDPEASQSSMQMRAALAKESARLFKLDNVEIKERHILVKGKLGSYSIHLGSGMVSKNGLQLSIIPVHSQHRGRMFLPFVDDDPKSAEIISKMRLLAQDDKIKDPTILAQINK